MKTKNLTFLLALTLLFLFSGSVFADDFQDGRDAANRGDFKTAYKLLAPLAEQGVADAQNVLGFMYSKGKGVPQDYKEALKWTRLSAEQGYATAQMNLGSMYGKGDGVLQDNKEEGKWYRLAAEQGHASAQFRLGFMYAIGTGVPQDYKEAVKWFRLAADQGHAKAQGILGVSKAIEKMLEKIKRKMAENEFAEFKNIQKGGMTCTYRNPYTGEMKYQWYVNDDAKGFKVFMNGVLLNDTQGMKQKNGLKILYKKFLGPDNQVQLHEIGVDMSFFNGGKFYLDFVKTQSIHDSIGLSYQGDCQKS